MGEALVQKLGVALRLLFALRLADELCGDLDEHVCKGQKDAGADHVEEGVEEGDLQPGVAREPLAQRRVQKARPAEQEDREDDRAEHVEHQVDERGALGVGLGADGGEQRRDAGADVGAEHEEEHAAVGRVADDHARPHHLHDEGGDRRGRLHDARDDDARQQQDEAVVDARQKVGDHLLLRRSRPSPCPCIAGRERPARARRASCRSSWSCPFCRAYP